MEKAKDRSQYKYTLKVNKSIAVDFSKDATYQQIHDNPRTIFQIPDSTKTFVGACKGDTLEETFATLYHYSLSQKDKKKSILLYLYYPKTYAKLEMDRLRYGFCDILHFAIVIAQMVTCLHLKKVQNKVV